MRLNHSSVLLNETLCRMLGCGPHKNDARRGSARVIEDLVQAEGRMLAAREKIDSSLADIPGYESIAGHINSALVSTAALAALKTNCTSLILWHIPFGVKQAL
jgi:hypothetical protein